MLCRASDLTCVRTAITAHAAHNSLSTQAEAKVNASSRLGVHQSDEAFTFVSAWGHELVSHHLSCTICVAGVGCGIDWGRNAVLTFGCVYLES